MKTVRIHFGLVNLACLCVLLSMLGATPLQAQDDAEAKAIAKVQEMGGTVSKIAAKSDEREVTFHLSSQDITDASLADLSGISGIVWLNLRGTKITDEGLAHVGKLTGLKRLHLEKTAVTDAGLDHLKSLENLEYLNLYGTQVSDAGLKNLEGLAKLKKLYLWQSKVSEDGAKGLIAKLADLQVNLGADLRPVPIEEKQEPLATGQFVRIRMVGEQQVLTLAEVEILGAEDDKVISGDATQSSTEGEASANRAIDGNKEQDAEKGSVAQTTTQDYPWWLVNLKEMKPIGAIKIHSRDDCVGDHLVGAIIEILDADKQVIWAAVVESGEKRQVHEFPAKKES